MSARIGVSLLVLLLLCSVGMAFAQPRDPQPVSVTKTYAATITTTMVGVSATDTAQLNVVNLFAGNPTSTAAPPSCSVTLQLVDAASGAVLNSSTATLGPGQIGSVDSLAKTLSGTPGREEIRGVASYSYTSTSQGNRPQQPPCSLAPTLEVYDTLSGKTQVVLTQIISAQ